jgi:membrane protein DedA with SNARE-associated domain
MLLIVLFSYLLEDGALIVAALLAADGHLSSAAAIAAVLFGLFTGDSLLYYIGRYARYHPLKIIKKHETKIHYYLSVLREKPVLTIIISRFTPGVRLPCYLALGYEFHQKPWVLGVLLLACTMWVIILFPLIYIFGSTIWSSWGPYRWLLLPLGLFIFYLIHKKTVDNK